MNRKKLIAFSISLAMTVVPVTPAAAAGAEQNTEGPSECGAGFGIREQSGGFQWKGK